MDSGNKNSISHRFRTAAAADMPPRAERTERKKSWSGSLCRAEEANARKDFGSRRFRSAYDSGVVRTYYIILLLLSSSSCIVRDVRGRESLNRNRQRKMKSVCEYFFGNTALHSKRRAQTSSKERKIAVFIFYFFFRESKPQRVQKTHRFYFFIFTSRRRMRRFYGTRRAALQIEMLEFEVLSVVSQNG